MKARERGEVDDDDDTDDNEKRVRSKKTVNGDGRGVKDGEEEAERKMITAYFRR